MNTVTAFAPDGVPEVREGDDLAALLLDLVELTDRDVVVITSKVVSKSEGRVVDGDRATLLATETARVVARRAGTTIVRTRHGLTLAAAGIDASNVEQGRAVLLPVDPDASARRLRAALQERTGLTLGVIITDTAGRAWREGQTDIAIGVAGLMPLESFAGRVDAHGNELAVTAPAVADEMAGVAELAQGKLGSRPFAVVRGRGDVVLPSGDDGPGAAALIRPDDADLFGYGAREAVLRAVQGDLTAVAPFGAPADAEEFAAALTTALDATARLEAPDDVRIRTPREDAARMLGFAFGWALSPPSTTDPAGDLRFCPLTP